MFILNLILIGIACYFAKQSYDDYRIGMAMFWAGLLGWDLHTLVTYL
jgi:hypothetical protein